MAHPTSFLGYVVEAHCDHSSALRHAGNLQNVVAAVLEVVQDTMIQSLVLFMLLRLMRMGETPLRQNESEKRSVLLADVLQLQRLLWRL